MERNEAYVGQRVYFGRGRGEQTLGEIVKINQVRAKVKQLEGRGMHRIRPVGTIWTVPFSLMTPAESDAKPAPMPFTTVGARKQAMGQFRVGDHVEFTDKRGNLVQGRVMRVNRKTISVQPDGETGLRYWRVSPSFLHHVKQAI